MKKSVLVVNITQSEIRFSLHIKGMNRSRMVEPVYHGRVYGIGDNPTLVYYSMRSDEESGEICITDGLVDHLETAKCLIGWLEEYTKGEYQIEGVGYLFDPKVHNLLERVTIDDVTMDWLKDRAEIQANLQKISLGIVQNLRKVWPEWLHVLIAHENDTNVATCVMRELSKIEECREGVREQVV